MKLYCNCNCGQPVYQVNTDCWKVYYQDGKLSTKPLPFDTFSYLECPRCKEQFAIEDIAEFLSEGDLIVK